MASGSLGSGVQATARSSSAERTDSSDTSNVSIQSWCLVPPLADRRLKKVQPGRNAGLRRNQSVTGMSLEGS